YQRCLKQPDLPGNQWPAGAAQARCALLRGPRMALPAVAAMLARPGGAKRLDAHYARAMKDHYEDPSQPEALALEYWLWDGSPEVGRVAERWLRQAPDSPYAMVALGNHLVARGLEIRGGRIAKDTPDSQMVGMEQLFQRARPMLKRAHNLQPKLTPACVSLYAIAFYTADITLSRAVVERCRATDPASWEMFSDRQWWAAAEGWGSDRELGKTFDDIRALQGQHPLLASLAVEVEQARGFRSAAMGEYLKYGQALGPAALQRVHPGIIMHAGMRAFQQHDYLRAEVFLTQALRFLPKDSRAWYRRALIREAAGRGAEALADARRAQQQGSKSPELQQLLARLQSGAPRAQ
ncbi:MAG: hypothetical protein ACREP7_17520, partial [Lysobacter sp.]